MPIYVPGKRSSRGRNRLFSTKRNVVAVLQLTAMVDMFTVLVVFLLQNYASTNQILPISDQVDLPQASAVKELKPSFVIILNDKDLSFNERKISTLTQIKKQKDWLIEPLFQPVKDTIEEFDQKGKSVSKKSDQGEDVVPIHYKVTLQADKDIDFLTIKKILYTLTEAGVQEVNFAVVQTKPEDKYGI